MARKQTRRSISVSISTYTRLKERCDALNLSLSGVVESQIASFLGLEAKKPTPKQGDRKPRRPNPAPEAPIQTLTEPVVAPVVIEFVPKKEKVIEVPPAKKEGVVLDDIASKIFTF